MRERAGGALGGKDPQLSSPEGAGSDVRVRVAMQRRMIQRKADAAPAEGAGGDKAAEGGDQAAAGGDQAGDKAAEGGEQAAEGGGEKAAEGGGDKAAEGGDQAAAGGEQAAAGAEGGEEEGGDGADKVEPLPEDVKEKMERSFGVDFSGVKIHEGAKAAQLSKQLGAQAFTKGADIYFAPGAYNPSSAAGRELIAHELTHVVQQGAAPKKEAPPGDQDAKDGGGDDAEAAPAESASGAEPQTKLEVSAPGDAAEQEADSLAAKVVAGEGAQPQAKSGARIHRSPAPGGEKAGEKAAGEPAAAGAAAPGADKAQKPPPMPGATGILTGEATVKLKDKEVKLTAGTVVKVVAATGDKLKVNVYSGHDGQEGEVDLSLFKPEPGVAVDENTGKERDDVYKDFGKAALWGADGPKPDDVKQGYIGDCYLMAAMGAVAAANPGALKALFSPQEPGAPAYSVSLFTRDPNNNQLVKQSVSVDTMMPALNKEAPAGGDAAAGGGGDGQLAYGGLENTEGSAKLWPSLIEKAYAQIGGGYDAIGKGGSSATAMEALTGVEGDSDAIPKKDQVIGQFQQYQKDGKAVVCGTLGSMAHKMEKAFTEKDGEYSGKMTTAEGDSICEIMQNTLEVRDDKSKHHFQAGDDGKGKLVSPDLDDSSVGYGDAKVSMKFKEDKKPEAAENLTAEYDYRGRISKDLELFAWHAYIFERIDGENLIFKNPWGTWHPKPIPADEFVKLFSSIYTDAVPKPEDPPPGG